MYGMHQSDKNECKIIKDYSSPGYWVCEPVKVAHWPTVSELDALGDELLLDDDSSYLDEASAAPSIPEGVPSDSKTNKVTWAELIAFRNPPVC